MIVLVRSVSGRSRLSMKSSSTSRRPAKRRFARSTYAFGPAHAMNPSEVWAKTGRQSQRP